MLHSPFPPQTFQPSLLGFSLLSPHFHGRLFIITPLLNLPEQAVPLYFSFENLESSLHIIIVYPYLQLPEMTPPVLPETLCVKVALSHVYC